jgi:hypothetical protein
MDRSIRIRNKPISDPEDMSLGIRNRSIRVGNMYMSYPKGVPIGIRINPSAIKH